MILQLETRVSYADALQRSSAAGGVATVHSGERRGYTMVVPAQPGPELPRIPATRGHGEWIMPISSQRP